MPGFYAYYLDMPGVREALSGKYATPFQCKIRWEGEQRDGWAISLGIAEEDAQTGIMRLPRRFPEGGVKITGYENTGRWPDNGDRFTVVYAGTDGSALRAYSINGNEAWFSYPVLVEIYLCDKEIKVVKYSLKYHLKEEGYTLVEEVIGKMELSFELCRQDKFWKQPSNVPMPLAKFEGAIRTAINAHNNPMRMVPYFVKANIYQQRQMQNLPISGTCPTCKSHAFFERRDGQRVFGPHRRPDSMYFCSNSGVMVTERIEEETYHIADPRR